MVNAHFVLGGMGNCKRCKNFIHRQRVAVGYNLKVKQKSNFIIKDRQTGYLRKSENPPIKWQKPFPVCIFCPFLPAFMTCYVCKRVYDGCHNQMIDEGIHKTITTSTNDFQQNGTQPSISFFGTAFQLLSHIVV